MGAALDVPVMRSFTTLKNTMDTNKIRMRDKETLQRFEQAGQRFFDMYNRCINGNKLAPENFQVLFDYVQQSFDAMNGGCRPKLTMAEKTAFLRDLTEVLGILTPLLEILTLILGKFMKRLSPILLSEFAIAIQCFRGTVQVAKTREPPFYRMNVIPIISLCSTLLEERGENISVVAPDNSGKTHTLPLLLAMKMCDEFLERRFLVLCESDPVMVTSVVERVEDMFAEDEDVIVVSTADQALEQFQADQKNAYQPVLCVLSPLEALSMLMKCEDRVTLLSKTRFIFDDIHIRSIETDVLLTLVTKAATECHLRQGHTVPAHIILVSATPDPFVTGFVRNVKELSCAAKHPFDATIKNVQAKDGNDLRNLILTEAKQILLDWGIEHPKTPVGSMIVFMPGRAVGYRFAAGIRKALERSKTQRPLVPLLTDVTPNDTATGFFGRVLREIDLKIAEKGEAFERQNPLFFVPIVVDRSFNSDMVEILTQPIHTNLAKKLVRVIIMTESTSSYNVPDVTAVLDSGIHEVEYFDVASGFPYIQEELVPKSYRDERQGLVGRTNFGIAVLFDIAGQTRPDSEVPAVHRIDLSKPSLALRRYGCDLETIQGLPNQPKYELFEGSINMLQKVKILNEKRQITAFGKEAVKFSFLHPLFAASVAKFMEGRNSLNASVFACTVFFIVENGFEMVTDPVNPIFSEFFEPKSDLVTVMMTIIKILESEKDSVSEWCSLMTKSGFRPNYLFELKDRLNNISGKNNQEVVKILKDWISEKGNAFKAIDEVITCARGMDNTWFDNRKAQFVQIMNAGSAPFIEFRCSRELIGTKDRILRMQRRPGWQGLTTPGSCFILSIRCNKTRQVSYGFLIHECSDKPEYGVVSIEVEPWLNTVFFVSLFEAFMGEKAQTNDYVGIQMSEQKDPRTSFVINITKSGSRTLLNYCPKNRHVHERTLDALKTIKPLLPFVPRSILVNYPSLQCAVEIMSISTLENDSRLHFYVDPPTPIPKAYSLNAQILKQLAGNTKLLASGTPKYRFAITGEAFTYRRVDGRQRELDLGYPDVRPELSSVFGEWASHLVLLVDEEESGSIKQPSIPWTGPAKPKDPEKEDPMEMIEVASRIMEANGSVKRSADLFVITLNDCALRAEKGELSPELMTACNATDKRTMRCNFAQLRKALGKDCLRHREIPPVPIEELGSVSTNSKAPRVPNINQFTGKLQSDICAAYKLGKDHVSVLDRSRELLFCRVDGLPLDVTLHDKPTGLYDETYKPCPADTTITKLIDSQYHPCVIHSTCIGFTIDHTEHQNLSVDDFQKIVVRLKEKYGCFVMCFEDYVADRGDTDKLGSMFIEVCDGFIAVALAQDIRSLITADASFKPEEQLLATQARRTRTASNRARVLEDLGNEKFGDLDVDQLQELVAMRGGRADTARFMARGRNLRAKERLLIQLMKDTDRVLCDMSDLGCGEENRALIPTPVFVYQQDGTAEEYAICRHCHLAQLQELVGPFFNQATHIIDFARIQEQPDNIAPISSTASDVIDGAFWPMVPLGSFVYGLLTDTDCIAPYVRAWVTVCAGLAIASSVNQITACPNHRIFPMRVPKDQNMVLECPHCNWIMCRKCNVWYSMDEPHLCAEYHGKKCPRCNKPTFKVKGCNHITCDCGCHWCYVCGANKCSVCGKEFNDSTIYTHMRKEHGGIYT